MTTSTIPWLTPTRALDTARVGVSHGMVEVVILHTYLPMKMEQTECSETLAYKIQTPGSHPEKRIKHSEHGESLKSRTCMIFWTPVYDAMCCRMPFDRQCHVPQRNIPQDLNIIKIVFITTGFLTH